MVDTISDPSDDALLDVEGLRKYFPIHAGLSRRVVANVRAVEDVSFAIPRGKTLSLVGESGCGKSTTSRAVMRALDVTGGSIRFRRQSGEVVDIAGLSRAQMKPLRSEIQMVFQDPFSSLNPRMTVADIIGEPLLVNGIDKRQDRVDRVAELMRRVGLPAQFMQRFPHAFSGGQRQRIGIARALALNPSLMVLDEPVSALDVSVQAQVLNLLLDLQDELALTYLFVAHDLSVVKHISDQVAVMYLGSIVELADTCALFDRPLHPYTEALLSAVPIPNPRKRSTRVLLRGEVGSPIKPPPGCPFHPRCAYAQDRCRAEVPRLERTAEGRQVRCHRAHELDLSGVGSMERPV